MNRRSCTVSVLVSERERLRIQKAIEKACFPDLLTPEFLTRLARAQDLAATMDSKVQSVIATDKVEDEAVFRAPPPLKNITFAPATRCAPGEGRDLRSYKWRPESRTLRRPRRLPILPLPVDWR